MKKTKKLPKIKHFYSSLSEETIKQEDYDFAKKSGKNSIVKTF